MKTTVAVLGEGGHGKDTFANMLADHLGFSSCSSSWFACPRLIYPWFLEHLPETYSSLQECYEDRHNWRPLWFQLIRKYNVPKRTRLAEELLELHHIYTGMRCPLEWSACGKKKLFNFIFWVDASGVKPPEDKSSMGIEYDPATMIRIPNTSTLKELERQAYDAAELILDAKKRPL